LVIIVSIVCDLLLFQAPCETETWHCLPAVSGLKSREQLQLESTEWAQ